MKIAIRIKTFETNSSSSHSLTWGGGSYSWPCNMDIPDYPQEDDYPSWEEWYDDYIKYKEVVAAAIPVSSAPFWVEETTWKKTASGEDWPMTTYTLEPDVFNKLTALIWLVKERAGMFEIERWASRISAMFGGIDVSELFDKVKYWDGQYIEAKDAAEILNALQDDETLAHFLFDPESTILARFAG